MGDAQFGPVRVMAVCVGLVIRLGSGIVPDMAVTTGREYGVFIDGELREPESGDVRELVEPATGEPLGRAAMAGDADVDRAVTGARSALEGAWAKTSPTERSRLLHALADAIVANRGELAELEARNVGKAISSVKAELCPSGSPTPRAIRCVASRPAL